MSRIKVADKMIQYLEDRINCKNVMKFAEEKTESILEESDDIFISELKIDSTIVSFQIIKYDDTQSDETSDKRNKASIKIFNDNFDFMTGSNLAGFEYFPYLYGVLNCHLEVNSKVYIYYENFEGSLLQLINLVEHASEWYDIAFQLVVIDHYVRFISGYQYHTNDLKNFLYKKHPKPYYRQYDITGHNFSVSNKYLIVLWDIELTKRPHNASNEYTIIDAILDYVKKETSIKIPPSNRIIKMFQEIKQKPENTIELLEQYYSRPGTNPSGV